MGMGGGVRGMPGMAGGGGVGMIRAVNSHDKISHKSGCCLGVLGELSPPL